MQTNAATSGAAAASKLVVRGNTRRLASELQQARGTYITYNALSSASGSSRHCFPFPITYNTLITSSGSPSSSSTVLTEHRRISLITSLTTSSIPPLQPLSVIVEGVLRPKSSPTVPERARAVEQATWQLATLRMLAYMQQSLG